MFRQMLVDPSDIMDLRILVVVDLDLLLVDQSLLPVHFDFLFLDLNLLLIDDPVQGRVGFFGWSQTGLKIRDSMSHLSCSQGSSPRRAS